VASLAGAGAAGQFSYGSFTQRNIGFVTEAEQRRIRDARVFVCGVGGMGGAALLSLVRAGVGHLAFADIDRFEVSNLNRQVFAFLHTVGVNKVEAVHRQLLDINPEVEIENWGVDWVDQVDALLQRYPIAINGMDDIRCGILLYRTARERGATVIDAYTSPLPSVTVVRPHSPRPEERLHYPSVGKNWRDISKEDALVCLLREIEYVMTHSSSSEHIDLGIAAEVVAGTRSRMSFAPMVITTGNLMCFEAINLILGWRSGTDHRGYFFNPWTARVERPRSPPVAWATRLVVRRFLKRMIDGR